VWLCTPFTLPALAQDRVRAKVGIQVRSNERTVPAKATETVKTGDSLRVYVVPEDDAYVYVVHNDGKTSSLLNAQDTKTKRLFAIIEASSKSCHKRLKCAFACCVHFVDHMPSAGSA
jgi:hypothetical protein